MNLPVVNSSSGVEGGSGSACCPASCRLSAGGSAAVTTRTCQPSTAPPVVGGVPFSATETYCEGLMIGLDVGSTTVKAVVIDPIADEILWQDYQRHETRQPEKVLEFLEAIENAFPDVPQSAYRLFLTGSGGSALVRHLGGKFVHEVNAVSQAVEELYPDVCSVVELGGQDAKIIIFKELGANGKKKFPSMNDKCAGGTGAVLDKISAKLGIPPEQLGEMGYRGIKLHPVAGKCGVFAETDVNSLQKQGTSAAELMASLFESIIQQNLSVLTRGHTLRPTVLLLGGPNTYIRGMRECWQHNIPIMWKERGVGLPDPAGLPEDYIITPGNAHLFAAIGAVEVGKTEVADDPDIGRYLGRQRLRSYLEHGRAAEKAASGMQGLWRSEEELGHFMRQYKREPWEPARPQRGELVEAFIGIDGGSTSTKGVLLSTDRTVLAKAYQLSGDNPIEDTKQIIGRLEEQVRSRGARLEVLAVGTTGYAKDILRQVLRADVALVETVAHTQACLHFYPGADVIADVGGQDIKLIFLKDGRVKDFRLNTQCSAGNGYFLQATAADLGFDVNEYADVAFSARTMPEFGYGCAVFLQSDIVGFQRQGWQANEILAGLAAVLPKNVWLYVAQVPNLTKLGSKFVLQGGTQRNLAVVKAQVDFIRSRFRGTGIEPEIIIHKHCAESGAIGCALEARRVWAEQGRVSSFIGLERVRQIRYTTTRHEGTRCYFCKNRCLRTFIDVATGNGHYGVGDGGNGLEPTPAARAHLDNGNGGNGHYGTGDGGGGLEPTPAARVHLGNGNGGNGHRGERKLRPKIPLPQEHKRLIIATCEKGTVEEVAEMRRIKAGLDEVKKRNPNFVEIASKSVFRELEVDNVADPLPRVRPWNVFRKAGIAKRRTLIGRRGKLRIGLPRVLNMYSLAPFFLAYFTSLGVPYRNVVFSRYTDRELYKRGAKRGSIDPCYPSKLGIPHVHDLLYRVHKRRPLTHIFFPMVDTFPTWLREVQASRACPTAVATADATHAAFTKEVDLFGQNGIVFKKTFLNLDEPQLCARQMYEDWRQELGLSFKESLRAVRQGIAAIDARYDMLRRRARAVLDALECDNRIGIVVLGRPYHNDPGINHEILEGLQKNGYPIFWQDALPHDEDILERLFGDEVRAGVIDHPMSIDDVWKNSYSESSSRKLWAAKYTARHPNLVALELSSFKCGHDAPIYTAIEEIIEATGTPYFCFKDIDENRPVGSIKIRIETIVYFLSRYRERLAARA